MRLTEEELENRKRRLIQIAFDLFRERGIEAVSLMEITQKAQVGENCISRYFGSKEKLVLEVLVLFWDSVSASVLGRVESVEDYGRMTGYEQTATWLEALWDVYLENTDIALFSVETRLYLRRHNLKIEPMYEDLLSRATHDPCVKAIEKGKADGSILNEDSSEDLFYAMWGTIRGYVIKMVTYCGTNPEDNPWESRYRIVANGILHVLRSSQGGNHHAVLQGV